MRKNLRFKFKADNITIAEAKGESMEDFDNILGDLKKKFGRGKK